MTRTLITTRGTVGNWWVQLWLISLMCAEKTLPQVWYRWSAGTEVREVLPFWITHVSSGPLQSYSAHRKYVAPKFVGQVWF